MSRDSALPDSSGNLQAVLDAPSPIQLQGKTSSVSSLLVLDLLALYVGWSRLAGRPLAVQMPGYGCNAIDSEAGHVQLEEEKKSLARIPLHFLSLQLRNVALASGK